MIEKDKTFHFIGIKGSGMSALAHILYDEGYQVQGSDVDTYFFTQRGLEEKNIKILPFDEKNIHEGQSIILGNAFSDDHPEAKRARELNLTISRYNHFLGDYIKRYTSVGIAGAHGKTSTTGLMAHVLKGLKKTSYLIGEGTGVGVEDAEYFVLEADEYRSHFLSYEPDYGIITNIDYDHPDYFKDLEHVVSVFEQYANQVQKALIAYGDDPNVRNLDVFQPVYYYGLEDDNDFVACHIEKLQDGSQFEVVFQGKSIGHFKIPLYGDHNIKNATAVIAVCYLEGLDLDKVKEEFLTYPGVKRRFNEMLVAGQHIVDDYAHHPNEIEATIDAAKQRYPGQNIVAIFQPHTFSRTEALLERFAEALSQADAIYLAPIFASAREQSGNVTIEDLASAIHREAVVLSEDDVAPLLDHREDVLLFMGAGDIQKYMQAYIDLLQK